MTESKDKVVDRGYRHRGATGTLVKSGADGRHYFHPNTGGAPVKLDKYSVNVGVHRKSMKEDAGTDEMPSNHPGLQPPKTRGKSILKKWKAKLTKKFSPMKKESKDVIVGANKSKSKTPTFGDTPYGKAKTLGYSRAMDKGLPGRSKKMSDKHNDFDPNLKISKDNYNGFHDGWEQAHSDNGSVGEFMRNKLMPHLKKVYKKSVKEAKYYRDVKGDHQETTPGSFDSKKVKNDAKARMIKKSGIEGRPSQYKSYKNPDRLKVDGGKAPYDSKEVSFYPDEAARQLSNFANHKSVPVKSLGGLKKGGHTINSLRKHVESNPGSVANLLTKLHRSHPDVSSEYGHNPMTRNDAEKEISGTVDKRWNTPKPKKNRPTSVQEDNYLKKGTPTIRGNQDREHIGHKMQPHEAAKNVRELAAMKTKNEIRRQDDAEKRKKWADKRAERQKSFAKKPDELVSNHDKFVTKQSPKKTRRPHPYHGNVSEETVSEMVKMIRKKMADRQAKKLVKAGKNPGAKSSYVAPTNDSDEKIPPSEQARRKALAPKVRKEDVYADFISTETKKQNRSTLVPSKTDK